MVRSQQRNKELIISQLQRDEPNYNYIQQWITTTFDNILNEPIDNNGNYILHYLCSNSNCPIDLIQYCIEQQQQQQQQQQEDTDGIRTMTPAIQLQNAQGKLPLHLACENNHTEQVIQLLLTNYRTAIEIPCTMGVYPLHYVCHYSSYASVIQLLLTMYPEALTQQCTGLQYNPLHWLCVNETISLEELFIQRLRNEMVITAAARQLQVGGCTPLHMICKNTKSSPESIKYLYEQYTDAVAIPDTNGYLPLHIACEYKQPIEIIECLLDMQPRKRYNPLDFHTSKDGWLPIHIACAYHNALPVIERVDRFEYPSPKCRVHPLDLAIENELKSDEIIRYLREDEQLKELDQLRVEYPLHEACQYQELESVQALLQQHPHAIDQKCQSGCYPLHYACAYSPYESVIEFLCNAYPKALEEQCEDGNTPLHTLCERIGLSIAILSGFLSSHKEFYTALLKLNEHGDTPLHIACKSNLSLEWIKYLVEQQIEATAIWDDYAFLPLHHACRWNESDDVIELLVSKYPHAVRTEGLNGLPLHSACCAGRSLRVIQLLVSVFPWALVQSIQYSENDKHRIPLNEAVEAEVSHDILSFLQEETKRVRFTVYQQIFRLQW